MTPQKGAFFGISARLPRRKFFWKMWIICAILPPIMAREQMTMQGISVVLVGAVHNPSFLNHDFLRYNNIVPDDAAVNAALPHICTPAVSQIAYEGGLQIASEPNKVSFQEDFSGDKRPGCPDIAIRYLKTVPLVKYTAAGINLYGFFPESIGEPENLLKSGVRQQYENASPSAEVKLAYSYAPQRFINLTINKGVVPFADGNAGKGILFHGNFHKNIEAGQNESYMIASTLVQEWESDLEHFHRLAEKIVVEMKGTQ